MKRRLKLILLFVFLGVHSWFALADNITNYFSSQTLYSGITLTTVYGVSGGSTNAGLLDSYHFAEGTGTHTYSAIYGTNVDGSLVSGPTWTNGLTDGALEFLSVGGAVVAFNNATNISKSFPLTLAYRIKPYAPLVDGEAVFGSDAIATTYAGYFSGVNSNGSIFCGFGDNTAADATGYRLATTTNTGLVTAGSFQNIVCEFSGPTNMSIFYAGTNYPVTYSGSGGSSPVYTELGQGVGFLLNGAPNLNGIVDEVQVFSNLLDSAYILTNYGPILSGYGGWTNLILSSSNLVAFYQLNENSGNTLHDASANALNGIFTNITALAQSGPYPGFFSAQFTSASLSLGVVTDTAKLDITGALTFGVWAKHTGSFTANQGMVSKYIGDSPLNSRSYTLYTDSSGYVNFTLSADGTFAGAKVLTYSTAMDTNWHYWVGVYVPSTSMTLYKDGVAVTNTTTGVPAAIYSGASDLTIGTQYSKAVANDIWSGYLSGVPIWNTNRSSTTISNEFYQATH